MLPVAGRVEVGVRPPRELVEEEVVQPPGEGRASLQQQAGEAVPQLQPAARRERELPLP